MKSFKYSNLWGLNLIYSLCFLFSMSLVTMAATQTLMPREYVYNFLKEYSQKEVGLIMDDLDNIRKLCFRDIITPVKGEKIYVATAGGPGASKSTILEAYLQDKPNFAYLDPDQRAIKFMINTYLQEFTNYNICGDSNLNSLLQKAYDKWRGASNYIASTLLNEAYTKGYNIAHGTTSTSEHIVRLYQKLKQNGYKINLLLCNSTDENRVEALEHRVKAQCFCQVDPNDIIKKGKMFPERFSAYFQYADEIHFYWIDNFLEGAILAATLIKGKKILIHDKGALQKFTEKYDQDRKDKTLESLQELIQRFESTV